MQFNLSDKQQQQLQQSFDEAVANYIYRLQERIDKLLDKVVCAHLGLTDHHGTLNLNNSHGRPALVAVIEKRINDYAEQRADEILAKHLAKVEKDTEFWKKIASNAIRSLRETIPRICKQKVNEAAYKYADSVNQMIDKSNFNLDLVPTKLDPQVPDSFETKIGELILELIAEERAEGRECVVHRKGNHIWVE